MKRSLMLMVVVAAVACGRANDGQGGRRLVIQNKGSDTLVNVAQAWAERYKTVDDQVAIAVSGGGSGTGISALLNGTVDIANASRRMKDKEIAMARKQGMEPVEFIVGYDALAVYLHPDNPIDVFTLDELAAIYGEGGPVDSWGDMGVTVPGCGSGEIVRVSRQNNSGTYAYFKQTALGKGREYKMGSRDMHGSKDVVDLVSHTPCAIGYSGLAYATDEVKMAKVSVDPGQPAVAPSIASASDGSYPIARPLFMYTRGEPTGAVKEYIDWILSEEGQAIILAKGYAPAKDISAN